VHRHHQGRGGQRKEGGGEAGRRSEDARHVHALHRQPARSAPAAGRRHPPEVLPRGRPRPHRARQQGPPALPGLHPGADQRGQRHAAGRRVRRALDAQDGRGGRAVAPLAGPDRHQAQADDGARGGAVPAAGTGASVSRAGCALLARALLRTGLRHAHHDARLAQHVGPGLLRRLHGPVAHAGARLRAVRRPQADAGAQLPPDSLPPDSLRCRCAATSLLLFNHSQCRCSCSDSG